MPFIILFICPLKGYNTYKVVYIQDGAIKETIDAQIDGNYLVFKTTHLSQYGVVAINETQETDPAATTTEENTTTADNTNNETSNIKGQGSGTGDSSNMAHWIVILFVSCCIGMGIMISGRKKNHII